VIAEPALLQGVAVRCFALVSSGARSGRAFLGARTNASRVDRLNGHR
jgi:hypothetical protein